MKVNHSGTSLTDLELCPTLYNWKHIQRLESRETPDVLTLGIASHDFLDSLHSIGDLSKALACIDSHYPQGGDNWCKARAMCECYATEHHPEKEYEVVSVETPWKLDCGDFTLSGRVDGVVRDKGGDLWILEHKTSAKPDENYLMMLERRLQTKLYGYFASQALNLPSRPLGIWYNILKKPALRRLQANSRRAEPESDPDYLKRLLERYSGDSDCFIRKQIFLPKSDERLVADEILKRHQIYKMHVELNNWVQSWSNCKSIFGRTCEFAPLCFSGGVPGDPGPNLSQFKTRKR